MLTTRPRATVTVKRRVSVGAVGCNCGSGSAANVMRAIGMKTAARMHGKTAKASDWTPEDWRAHIAEERTILFPALLAAGAPQSVIDSLDIDHSLYLALLDADQPLPIGAAPHSVDRHGKIEDDLVEKHAKALLASVGKVSVSGLAGGIDSTKMAADMEAAAAKDAADRAKRTAEANAKLDDWGKAVDKYSGTPLGSWASGTAKMALAVEGAIVRWAQGDWDSDDQKARALDSVKQAIDVGIVPEKFDAEIDFAKTYGDKVWTEINRIGELDQPWRNVFQDYARSLLANAGDPLIDSLIPAYSGVFSQELGAPALCAAIAAQEGKSNEASGPPSVWLHRYGLADMLAAVASARFGTPLHQNLETAYAALGKMIAEHPTICSGRGYKGVADSWEYDHGPYLYVLQAWIDLVPAKHRDAILHPGTLAEISMVDPWAGKYTAAAVKAPAGRVTKAAGYLAVFALAGYLAWRVAA